MAEYIEREALIQAFWDDIENGNQLDYGDTEELIRNAPAADVAPVVHGEWELVTIKYFPGQTARVGHCQNCGEERFVDNYCPNCGAKMDGGADRETG